MSASILASRRLGGTHGVILWIQEETANDLSQWVPNVAAILNPTIDFQRGFVAKINGAEVHLGETST